MITTYDVDASFTARVWSLHVRGLPGTASAVELDDVDRIARKFIAMHTHVPAADVHLLLHFCHPAREESPGDDDRSALRTGPVPAHGTTSYTRRRGRTGRAVERLLVGPSAVPALRAEGVSAPGRRPGRSPAPRCRSR